MAEQDATEQVTQVWEAVAPAWERHRRRLFEQVRPVSEWLVAQVEPEPGRTILELGCGPGDTGFLAAERLGNDGKLISTDVSPSMVDVARRGSAERDSRTSSTESSTPSRSTCPMTAWTGSSAGSRSCSSLSPSGPSARCTAC